MKRFFTCLLILVKATSSQAQFAFEKIIPEYDPNGTADHIVDLFEQPDSSILVAAAKTMYKLDPIGNMLWKTDYDSVCFNEWLALKSGDMLAIGGTTCGGNTIPHHLAVARIDRSGTMIWKKVYGSPGSTPFGARSAVLLNNTVYIKLETSMYTPDVMDCIMAMDTLGNILRYKLYQRYTKMDIYLGGDSVLIVTGRDTPFGNTQSRIFKADSSCSMIDSVLVDSASLIWELSMALDSGYYIYTTEVRKLDKLGQTEWSFGGDSTFFFDFIIESDSVFVVGEEHPDYGRDRMVLINLSPNGMESWRRYYWAETGYGVRRHHGGGFLLHGRGDAPGVSIDNVRYIIKTDAAGYGPACADSVFLSDKDTVSYYCVDMTYKVYNESVGVHSDYQLWLDGLMLTDSVYNGFEIPFDSAGEYDLSLVSCNDTDLLHIIVKDTLYPSFSYQELNPPSSTYMFIADSIPGYPSDDFEWYFGDGYYDWGDTVIHAYVSSGQFSVTLHMRIYQNYPWCARDTKDTIDVIISIDEGRPGLIRYRVFPNPSTTTTAITIEDNQRISAVKLYNIEGRLVREQESPSGTTITLHRDGLPSGIYFVEVIGDQGVLGREKIIVQ